MPSRAIWRNRSRGLTVPSVDRAAIGTVSMSDLGCGLTIGPADVCRFFIGVRDSAIRTAPPTLPRLRPSTYSIA